MSKLLTYRLESELDEKGEGWIVDQNNKKSFYFKTIVYDSDNERYEFFFETDKGKLEYFNYCVRKNGETKKQAIVRRIQEIEDEDNEYYKFLKINNRLREIE